MARPVNPDRTGRAVGGGGPKAPKPSRMRVGGTASRAFAAPVSALASVDGGRRRTVPTMRLSISTNAPDNGRSDQRVSAVTWNNTIIPLPRRAAVTSGVPSPSVAQVWSDSPASGSARTWRVTVTSFGTNMPLNGLSCENPANCWGLSQLRLPPRMRPPRRSLTGTSSSSEAASRGPAKRTRTPPSSTQRVRRSRASPATLPTSASTIIGRRCSMNVDDRLAGRTAFGEPDVGERTECPRQVERRGEQAAARCRRSSR